jgi:hypothetical protein
MKYAATLGDGGEHPHGLFAEWCLWCFLLMGLRASHMVGDASKRGVEGVSGWQVWLPAGLQPKNWMAGASSYYAQNPLYAERVNLRGLGRSSSSTCFSRKRRLTILREVFDYSC